ncbi:MAG TPA: tryptophan synthase subunit alpha [Allosphingosinicella sp.]|nr:tryptophan synthase subunit alpha [Allosphingosinicella sp.]
MNRYARMFARLERAGEGALGAFVMLGDPDLETSGLILDALVEGGADMLELGIPFSDPIADGPVIQAAAERALRRGVTPADCFILLRRFRDRHPDVPVGLLTYANIVMARGLDHFYGAAADSGVDSVLVADVPSIEAEPFLSAARGHGVAPVLIAAPNTPEPALRRIAGQSGGYTYCVARAGVTGVHAEPAKDLAALIAALRRFGAPPPILGFGIARPDQVRSGLDAGAAGIISGSAIVSLIAANPGSEAETVRNFVSALKAATRPLANPIGGPRSACR